MAASAASAAARPAPPLQRKQHQSHVPAAPASPPLSLQQHQQSTALAAPAALPAQQQQQQSSVSAARAWWPRTSWQQEQLGETPTDKESPEAWLAPPTDSSGVCPGSSDVRSGSGSIMQEWDEASVSSCCGCQQQIPKHHLHRYTVVWHGVYQVPALYLEAQSAGRQQSKDMPLCMGSI